jgi:hypothetical protein
MASTVLLIANTASPHNLPPSVLSNVTFDVANDHLAEGLYAQVLERLISTAIDEALNCSPLTKSPCHPFLMEIVMPASDLIDLTVVIKGIQYFHL